jgi:hypothetical protein
MYNIAAVRAIASGRRKRRPKDRNSWKLDAAGGAGGALKVTS